jgi:hypothetical protein
VAHSDGWYNLVASKLPTIPYLIEAGSIGLVLGSVLVESSGSMKVKLSAVMPADSLFDSLPIAYPKHDIEGPPAEMIALSTHPAFIHVGR